MALRVKHNPDKARDKNQPLSIEKLSVFRYGVAVIDELSLDVSRGEIVGIVGANGSGKTTLVTTIAGTINVSSKAIEYDHALHIDEELFDESADQRYYSGVHCVFEGRRLFGDLTVKDNLALAHDRTSSTDVDTRITEVTDLFPKMRNLLDIQVKDCSAAQQQIIAIARAIMIFPDVLILDEPTLGLDPASISAIAEVLKILASGSVGIVICEQRVSFVDEIADRKLTLEKGKLVEPVDQAIRAHEWKPKIEVKQDKAPPIFEEENEDEDDEWKPL